MLLASLDEPINGRLQHKSEKLDQLKKLNNAIFDNMTNKFFLNVTIITMKNQ